MAPTGDGMGRIVPCDFEVTGVFAALFGDRVYLQRSCDVPQFIVALPGIANGSLRT
jgi:hypothetical protein